MRTSFFKSIVNLTGSKTLAITHKNIIVIESCICHFKPHFIQKVYDRNMGSADLKVIDNNTIEIDGDILIRVK